jgi:hypothetical protein
VDIRASSDLSQCGRIRYGYNFFWLYYEDREIEIENAREGGKKFVFFQLGSIPGVPCVHIEWRASIFLKVLKWNVYGNVPETIRRVFLRILSDISFWRRCSLRFATNHHSMAERADVGQHVLKRQQEVSIYFIRVSTEIPRAYQRTMGCTKQNQELEPPQR